ncbi:hypothetical protein F5Y16DRAFT_184853 [Xylariaceae sp. FL0255]|nr:hypothetical protein F5Y16DRAFT_184853 [Xylariaceae sp. FL0255]
MHTSSSAAKGAPLKSMEFLWREARAQFLSQLSIRQQHKEILRDSTTTLENTITSLKTAHERAESAFGDKFKGTPIEFNLSRALKRLDLVAKLGDAAMEFAPETASYVWAAFQWSSVV